METVQQDKAQKLHGIIGGASGGTDKFYRHPLFGMGAYMFTPKALRAWRKHWLFDAIFSYKRKESFQLWILNVGKNDKTGKVCATLTMQEDTHAPVLVCQEIEYTDFPSGLWEFYLIDGTLLFPCEY
jgi:hypothetical protein